ncbi:unnamed protein product [Eruca vesicaria subsp. sativa]|uniref:Uncharacterized protein n=1 Tax=Eruca vesicaria subsp. sativa TaxID=29727 RepID=A0ABC8IS13_ERUVS|nr:unnamed protein product [Eruca vesicaria subsp. sativa]
MLSISCPCLDSLAKEPELPCQKTEVSLDGVSKEGASSGHTKIEHSAFIGGDDEMKIDGYLEANHEEYTEVTVEDQKHDETGDVNFNLPNLPSSETTDLLKESSNSLSPEAIGQDHDQVSSLDSIEAELGKEPSVRYNNTLEITKESQTENETKQQASVQSSKRNNVRNSGKVRAKRSRTRLMQLQPLKPFLLQHFKRISKRKKH